MKAIQNAAAMHQQHDSATSPSREPPGKQYCPATTQTGSATCAPFMLISRDRQGQRWSCCGSCGIRLPEPSTCRNDRNTQTPFSLPAMD